VSRRPVQAGIAPLGALALAASVVACSGQPSAYEQLASTVSAGFASARTTIEAVHTDGLTIPYAQASFVEYRSLLEGASDRLRETQPAPPDAPAIVAAVAAAERVVGSPCLEGGCDWQGQLATLDRARHALEPEQE